MTQQGIVFQAVLNNLIPPFFQLFPIFSNFAEAREAYCVKVC